MAGTSVFWARLDVSGATTELYGGRRTPSTSAA
jgi:hypothetical protein